MKMLVLVKQVPDTATQVKVGSDPRTIDQTGITWIVSPYDEFALEEALRIKEKRNQPGDEVVAVTSVRSGPRRRCGRAWPWGLTAPSTSTTRRSRARTR